MTHEIGKWKCPPLPHSIRLQRAFQCGLIVLDRCIIKHELSHHQVWIRLLLFSIRSNVLSGDRAFFYGKCECAQNSCRHTSCRTSVATNTFVRIHFFLLLKKLKIRAASSKRHKQTQHRWHRRHHIASQQFFRKACHIDYQGTYRVNPNLHINFHSLQDPSPRTLACAPRTMQPNHIVFKNRTTCPCFPSALGELWYSRYLCFCKGVDRLSPLPSLLPLGWGHLIQVCTQVTAKRHFHNKSAIRHLSSAQLRRLCACVLTSMHGIALLGRHSTACPVVSKCTKMESTFHIFAMALRQWQHMR